MTAEGRKPDRASRLVARAAGAPARKAGDSAREAKEASKVLEQPATSARQRARPMRRECLCLECGEAFTAARQREFCSRPCTRKWNNRRMVRGAMIFDLVMILRENRKLATLHKVWRTINRLARAYRDEDERDRAGRRSWRRLRAVKEGNPWLWAE